MSRKSRSYEGDGYEGVTLIYIVTANAKSDRADNMRLTMNNNKNLYK